MSNVLTVAVTPRIVTTGLFRLLDYSGVMAGALAGSLVVRKDTRFQFDYVGVIGLGMISGVGGGIFRDTLLQNGLPLALDNPVYLYLALGGALLGLFFGSRLVRRARPVLLVVDALGLGFFAIAGATRAEAAGLGTFPCLLLGVMTAVGGGAMRDVFSGRTPRIFERGEPYATSAALAVMLFLTLLGYHVQTGVATFCGVATGFLVRLLGVRYGWKTRAMRLSED